MDEAHFEKHQEGTYNVIQMAFQYAERSVSESGIDSDCPSSFGSFLQLPELARPACRFPGEGTFLRTPTSQPTGSGDEDISSLPELSPEVISQLDEFLDNFFIPPIEPKDDDSSTSSKNVDRLSEEHSTTFGREKFVTYIEWESIGQNNMTSPIENEVSETTQNTQDEPRHPEKTTVQCQFPESPVKESEEMPPCPEVCKEVYQQVSKNTDENPRTHHSQSDRINASTCDEDSVINFESLAQYLETADDYALGVDILSEFNQEVSTATDLIETTTSENNNSCSFVAEPLSRGSSQELAVSWSPQSYSVERSLASTPVSSGDESSGYLSASDIESSSGMLHINSQPVSPIQSPSTPSTPRYSERDSTCCTETKVNQDKEEEENKKKSVKQKKPAETYVSMIAKAMLANGLQRMSLSDLYAKIEELFPYYKTSTITWRNAVRHNLSINECFVKAGRTDSGRGFYWTIHPSCVEVFKNGKYKRREARRRVQNLTRMGTVSITPFTPMTLHLYQDSPDINNYQFTVPVQMSSTAINAQIQGLEAHADMLTLTNWLLFNADDDIYAVKKLSVSSL